MRPAGSGLLCVRILASERADPWGPGRGQLPYSTAQHIPRRQASLRRGVYATSETALVAWQAPCKPARPPVTHTTVRVVTGEIPVRFMGCIPLNGRHDTFDRKYGDPAVCLRGLMPGSRPPPRRRLLERLMFGQAAPDAASVVRSGSPGGQEPRLACTFERRDRSGHRNRVASAWPERRANRRGAAPTVGGGRYPSRWQPRLPRNTRPFRSSLFSRGRISRNIKNKKGRSRGDPPPVPPLTETVRATADPKARQKQRHATPRARHGP